MDNFRKLVSSLIVGAFSVLHAHAQSWLWVMPPATNTLGNSETKSVALDSLGNVFVLGYCDSPATVAGARLPSRTYFVTKLNGLGQPQWALPLGLPGQRLISARLTAAQAGQVYVTGQHTGTVTFGTTVLTSPALLKIFVAALDGAGQWRWAVEAPGATNLPALTLTPNGQELWLGGSFRDSLVCGQNRLNGPPTLQPMYLARLQTASGMWLGAWAIPGSFPNQLKALAATDSSTVYVTGASAGTLTFGATSLTCLSAPGSCGFVAKFSATHGWLWARDWGSDNSSVGNAIALHPLTQNPIVGGRFGGQTVLDTIRLTISPTYPAAGLLACLNAATGRWAWAKKTGAMNQRGPFVDALAVDKATTVYACGFVNLNNQNVIFGTDTVRGLCSFIASADSRTGQWQHAWPIRGGSGGNIQTLAAGAVGDVVVGGSVGPTSPQFGPFTVPTNPAAGTAYVAHMLDPNPPTGLPPLLSSGSLALWPNPASGTTSVSLSTASPASRVVEVYDAVGQLSRRLPLPPHQVEILMPLAGLPPGLYLIRCGFLQKRLVITP